MYRAASGDAPVMSVPAQEPQATASEVPEIVTPSDSPAGPPAAVAGSESSSAIELAKAVEAQNDEMVSSIAEMANELIESIKCVSVVVKAGRVLSAANEDKLRQAYDMIGSVLSQVQIDDEDEDECEDEPKAFRLVVSEPAPSAGVSKEKLAQLLKETVRETVESSIRRAMGRVD
jgi:carbamate kinase